MGQYQAIVNLDKRVFIDPSAFGDHLKLREFGTSAGGAMSALALLLARHNGRGIGDAYSTHPAVGSWAGDRIAIVGEYGDAGDLLSDEERAAFLNAPLYRPAKSGASGWRDVSGDAILAMLEDGAFAEELLTCIGPDAPLWARSDRYPAGVRERLLACARDRAPAKAA